MSDADAVRTSLAELGLKMTDALGQVVDALLDDNVTPLTVVQARVVAESAPAFFQELFGWWLASGRAGDAMFDELRRELGAPT